MLHNPYVIFFSTEMRQITKKLPIAQHDGVRTTMKKGTTKILSKSISRMPMGSLVGQKNLICHRIL